MLMCGYGGWKMWNCNLVILKLHDNSKEHGLQIGTNKSNGLVLTDMQITIKLLQCLSELKTNIK